MTTGKKWAQECHGRAACAALKGGAALAVDEFRRHPGSTNGVVFNASVNTVTKTGGATIGSGADTMVTAPGYERRRTAPGWRDLADQTMNRELFEDQRP